MQDAGKIKLVERSNSAVSIIHLTVKDNDVYDITVIGRYIDGNVDGLISVFIGSAAEEPILITMQLPYEWNTTSCRTSSGRTCDVVHIYTCVLFQASKEVFPSGR